MEENILKNLKLDTMELFSRFENIFIDLIEFRRGDDIRNKKNPNYLYYQQEFIKRFFECFLALKELYKGKQFKKKEYIYDISFISPVFVLMRSCLENYALFYYIYINPTENEVKELRFKCWWREGLMRRQKFYTNQKEYIEQKNEEKKSIDKIFDEIKITDFYKDLKRDKKEKIEKYGTWIFNSYENLLSKAGFKGKNALNCYGYLSSYIHNASVIWSNHLLFNCSNTTTPRSTNAFLSSTNLKFNFLIFFN